MCGTGGAFAKRVEPKPKMLASPLRFTLLSAWAPERAGDREPGLAARPLASRVNKVDGSLRSEGLNLREEWSPAIAG